MGMTPLLSIATTIGGYLVDPVKRQFGYLILYDRNIKNLEDAVQKVEYTRDTVQRRVDEGKRNCETVEKYVEKWLGDVDNPIEEAKGFLENDVKANKGCLNGWCPNLKSRYSLGKKAKKKTKVLEKLFGTGIGFATAPVTYPTPIVEISFKSNGDFRIFESRKLIMNKVMEALTSDGTDDFAKLKKLEIINCGDLQYLINPTDWVSHTASDGLGLEELTLKRLPALTHVWKGPTQLEKENMESSSPTSPIFCPISLLPKQPTSPLFLPSQLPQAHRSPSSRETPKSKST
ncbi:hypothetical protein U1Q18_007711 [Sarracenia purpurea var. burkii]